MFKLNISDDELCRLAFKLGCDVPFFIRGGVQLSENKGEKLTPVDLKLTEYFFLLIHPNFKVSTKWAYSFFKNELPKTFDSDKFRSFQDDIDWKLFARSDKLFVKRFEEETNLRCQIIIDTSSSMYYPNFNSLSLNKPNKVLFSVYATGVLINLLKKQRDAVGLSTFSNDIENHILAKTSTRHHQLLYHELGNILSIDAKLTQRTSSTISALHQIAERINQRSL